jgi:hypothetical protein
VRNGVAVLVAVMALLLAPRVEADPAAVRAEDSPLAEPAVPTIHSGLRLEVEAIGAVRYEGAFSGMGDEHLLLSTRDGVVEIPMAVVLSIEIGGVSYGPEAFTEGARRWGQAMLDEAVRTPRPVLVGGLSVLWAGAGPAALGNWKSAAAYSVLEASFLGAGAVMIANEQYGPLLPLAALDALLHAWAAGDSVRESRRRRSRADLAIAPLGQPVGATEQGLGVALVLRIGGPPAAQAGMGRAPADACVEPGLTGACSFP